MFWGTLASGLVDRRLSQDQTEPSVREYRIVREGSDGTAIALAVVTVGAIAAIIQLSRA
jgi:hypothetical protein